MLYCTAQSCVSREYRRQLSMQPCGVPVLTVREDVMRLPIGPPVAYLSVQDPIAQMAVQTQVL